MIPHSLNGVYPDGSRQVLWEDGERAFCRVRRPGDDGPSSMPHGGRLWAEANEPRGAVFQFTLPSAQETHEFSSGGSPEWRAS